MPAPPPRRFAPRAAITRASYCGGALELPDGTIGTGKNSPLLHAASSMFLNAVKRLAGLRRLGANLTCDPNFATKDLIIS